MVLEFIEIKRRRFRCYTESCSLNKLEILGFDSSNNVIDQEVTDYRVDLSGRTLGYIRHFEYCVVGRGNFRTLKEFYAYNYNIEVNIAGFTKSLLMSLYDVKSLLESKIREVMRYSEIQFGSFFFLNLNGVKLVLNILDDIRHNTLDDSGLVIDSYNATYNGLPIIDRGECIDIGGYIGSESLFTMGKGRRYEVEFSNTNNELYRVNKIITDRVELFNNKTKSSSNIFLISYASYIEVQVNNRVQHVYGVDGKIIRVNRDFRRFFISDGI